METIVALTIGAIVFVLTGLNIVQAWIIFGLLNRVLLQAKVPPLEGPTFSEEKESPQQTERRKLFSIDIPS